MLPRPRFRMPLWTALAVAAGAWAIRSVMRGFDFGLDLPMDAIVLAMLLIVVAMVAWVRAQDTSENAEDVSETYDAPAEGKDPES